MTISSKANSDRLLMQLGYYGVALNHSDDLSVLLPEELIMEIIESTNLLDHSRTFALMLDFFCFTKDLFRVDVFISISQRYSDRSRAILCGLMEKFDKRKFAIAIQKIRNSSTCDFICSSPGRMSSFGEDSIMKQYGIVCTPINQQRDDKKIVSRKALYLKSTVMRNRIIIGPTPRADYFSLREERPDTQKSEIYKLAFISKTSAVYAERDFKIITKHDPK